MTILEQAQQEKEYIVALRRYFHQHPELSLQEYETAKKIEEELTALGVEHKRVGETGVLGIIKGNLAGDKVVALRADTDALRIPDEKQVDYASKNSGVMHACGHDAHTAALLGAAKILVQNKDDFGGEIRLIFQQAEEVGAGAVQFIDAGVLNGVDRVFGIHVASDLEAGRIAVIHGAVNASVDHFVIRVKGQAAHVSTPQKGSDAAYIASQIVVALQGIVSRRISPIESVIIGVGKIEAGTAYNIVAEHATIEGTTRTFGVEIRKFVDENVEEVAKSIAALYGATAEVEWHNYASALINSDIVCEEVKELVVDMLGQENLELGRQRSLGGDDFAEFLLQVPGVYIQLGTGSKAVQGSQGPAHCSAFDIDETALPIGAATHAEYALRFLNGNFR